MNKMLVKVLENRSVKIKVTSDLLANRIGRHE